MSGADPGMLPEGTPHPYTDRREAGRYLATHLLPAYQGRDDLLVLALPRGGVPVAFEVARALHAPLDVFLVRKLGVPGHEELAMGAIASGDVLVRNESVIQSLHIAPDEIEQVVRSERAELQRREQAYREGRPFPAVAGRVVLLVDDGLATGATMRAAVRALRQMHPSRLVVAVPVASADTCAEFHGEVDDILCARTPSPFIAVGYWYQDFKPTTDAEVSELLRAAGNTDT